MARFKIFLEYEGTRYSGWQIQKNARTVMGDIHNALVGIMKNADFELYGSGRTDAGVHALYQVAHLEAETMLGPEIIRMKLNDALPSDINVIEVEKAPKNFHARHDAVARSYLYQISRRRTAFGKRFVWWIKDYLNFSAMTRAAALFEGMKNFQSFTADDEEEKSMKVLIERIEIKESGDLILIRIVGSHFLWKMVRQIVGVLAEVGRGKMAVKDVERMLTEKTNTAAPLTAPPSGLFLERVYYQGGERLPSLLPMMTIDRPRALQTPARASEAGGAGDVIGTPEAPRTEPVKRQYKTTGGHADKHMPPGAASGSHKDPTRDPYDRRNKKFAGKAGKHGNPEAKTDARKAANKDAGKDARHDAFDKKFSAPGGDSAVPVRGSEHADARPGTRTDAFEHRTKKTTTAAGAHVHHGKKKDRRKSAGPGFKRRP